MLLANGDNFHGQELLQTIRRWSGRKCIPLIAPSPSGCATECGQSVSVVSVEGRTMTYWCPVAPGRQMAVHWPLTHVGRRCPSTRHVANLPLHWHAAAAADDDDDDDADDSDLPFRCTAQSADAVPRPPPVNSRVNNTMLAIHRFGEVIAT